VEGRGGGRMITMIGDFGETAPQKAGPLNSPNLVINSGQQRSTYSSI